MEKCGKDTYGYFFRILSVSVTESTPCKAERGVARRAAVILVGNPFHHFVGGENLFKAPFDNLTAPSKKERIF